MLTTLLIPSQQSSSQNNPDQKSTDVEPLKQIEIPVEKTEIIKIPPSELFLPLQNLGNSPSLTSSDSSSPTQSSPTQTSPQRTQSLDKHRKIKNLKEGSSTSSSQLVTNEEITKRKKSKGKSEPSPRDIDLFHEEKEILNKNKTPTRRNRRTSSIDIEGIKEVYRKKITKDEDPILSFRGPLHLQRRDSLIITSKEPDFTDFKEFKMFNGKEAEQLDSQFKDYFDKHFKEEVTRIECTAKIMSEIYNRLIEREHELIEEQTKENKLLLAIQMVVDSPRARELLGIIHNALLPSCPIHERLSAQDQILVQFSKESKKITIITVKEDASSKKTTTVKEDVNVSFTKTPFTESYHGALLELRSLKPVLETHKELLSKGINLPNFLSCINKIKDCHYTLDEGGSPKLLELNKKIYPLICLAFGDSKKKQDEVLELLKKWNNSSVMVPILKQELKDLTSYSIAKQNISCIEHLWSEPLNNIILLGNDILQSIDNTSYKDLIEYYLLYGRTGKISINGEILKAPEPFDEEKFFFQIISKLYLAFGFDIPLSIDKDKCKEKPSLESQIGIFVFCKDENIGHFSEETLACIRLLKMGGPSSQSRARKYLQVGLGDLLTDPLTLGPDNPGNETLFNFFIDKKNPQNFSVEKCRTYDICSSKDPTDIKVKVPTLWKVYSPINGKWNYSLRILKISIYDNAGRETIRKVEYHAVNFMQDDTLLEYMLKMGIQISQNLKNSLVPEAQGIEIIKMPSPRQEKTVSPRLSSPFNEIVPKETVTK